MKVACTYPTRKIVVASGAEVSSITGSMEFSGFNRDSLATNTASERQSCSSYYRDLKRGDSTDVASLPQANTSGRTLSIASIFSSTMRLEDSSKISELDTDINTNPGISINTNAVSYPIDLKDWTVWTFYTVRISVGSTGHIFTMLDYYFEFVHPQIPLLSRSWLLDHCSEVPLYLLHAIYTCCTKSEAHYTYIQKVIQEDLEQGNPMTVLTLLHLVYYLAIIGRTPVAVGVFGQALALSQYLKFHSPNERLFWKSPINTILGTTPETGQNFILSMWLFCYLVDFHCFMVSGGSLKIGVLAPCDAERYQPDPNLFEAKSKVDFYLKTVKFSVPIIRLSRKLFIDEVVEPFEVLLSQWNDLYNSIPPSIQSPAEPADKSAIYVNLSTLLF